MGAIAPGGGKDMQGNTMNILVIGGGGREHAIISKLRENASVETIYAMPGNGGIAQDAICLPGKATDSEAALKYICEYHIGFAVVAPDNPLVEGMADKIRAAGVPVFGPGAAAAAIEGSKVFSKNLMKKYNIPTAAYEVFDNAKSAVDYTKQQNIYPVVIKADGLALGKGVIIAQNFDEAHNAIHNIMEEKIFGESGNHVVIEEFLEGPEVTVLAFTDSKTIVPMVSSMDHKRAFDNDEGPNTGGMGVIAPNPFYTPDIADVCMNTIFKPTIDALNTEGRPFKGCLYFGLMLTKNGPKVIEYNCRFGDPEAQAVLPLLESDLFGIMRAVEEERLSDIEVKFQGGASCCVMAVSGGYPGKYQSGCEIKINNEKHERHEIAESKNRYIFHSGTALRDGKLVTAGGRVIGVTCVADDLQAAVDGAYRGIEDIHFDKMYYRHDIGKRALYGSL
jgi:phosphoribosylamine--glycine ligase